MKTPLSPPSRSIDLTADDLRAIIESVGSLWRIKVTRAPGPQSRCGATRWVYVLWVGPPGEDIVPSVAITRHHSGYRITILDPLELFASGVFEVMDCVDIARAAELVRAVVKELKATALDHARPDFVTAASHEAKDKRGDPKDLLELYGMILLSMSTDGMLS
jgi:hypothetical protein